MMALAANNAALVSASGKLGTMGAPSGSPFIAAKPLAASIKVPNPGRALPGPVWPHPEMRNITSFGWRPSRTSGPSPMRSRVPGTNDSISTSNCDKCSRRSARPSSALRFRVTNRLFRA